MKYYDWNFNNKNSCGNILKLKFSFLLGYDNASLDNREGATVLVTLNPCR